MGITFRVATRACFAFGITLALTGCPGESTDVQELSGGRKADAQNNDDTQVTAATQARREQSQCERKLLAAVSGTSYDRLDIETERAAQLADLNAWLTICRADGEPLTSDEDVRKRFLPGPMQPFVSQEQFLAADLIHMRDSILSRAIGDAAVTDASDDIQVMTDLFARVIRHVQLIAANGGELPYEPFELWQAGIGSVRDRVWLFSLLLRQYRLDTAVLEFPSGFNAEPYVLVAALTRGEDAAAYLFDPITGLPVPALADDGPIPSIPATWAEAQSNDAIFRQLDQPGNPYPVRSDRLETASLSIVGDVSLFAPRMAAVQDTLPPTDSVILYNGLGPNELASPGLLERVSTTLGVPGDSLQLWGHGLLVRLPSIAQSMSPQVKAIVDNRNQVMAAPFILQPLIDDKGQPVLGENGQPGMRLVPADMRDASNMRTARIAHLRGDFKKASRAYLAVRLASPLTEIASNGPSPNVLAASDAAYWAGVFQLESGEVATAKNSLSSFLKRNDRLFREPSVRRLLTEIFAREGQFAEAAAVAAGSSVDPGTLALLNRWQKQGRDLGNDPQQDDARPSETAAKELAESGSEQEKSPTTNDQPTAGDENSSGASKAEGGTVGDTQPSTSSEPETQAAPPAETAE